MSFELPSLPYDRGALAPHISEETLNYHYGKHHQAYVTKLNMLVDGTDLAEKPLETLIKTTSGPIFNNAAQVWNHTFYWNCLSPQGGGEPTGAIADAINSKFESFAAFKNKFNDKAINNFGSSWTWLVRTVDGDIAIENTSNAGNPISNQYVPLLTCDLWEHAYYVDYRNLRPKYLDAFWSLVNWDFVNKCLEAS